MPRFIDRHEVLRLVDAGAQLVEVLGRRQYEQEHLPGAVNIFLRDIPHKAPDMLERDRPVIVYCEDTLWDLSPRAAWRLETLGFGEVYDYVAGKQDWFGAGLPVEGTAAGTTRIGDLADREVPTCTLDEKVGEVRARLGDGDVCIVANDRRVVLGLVRPEHLEGDDRPVGDVMQEGPSTVRPNVPAAGLAAHLEGDPFEWALVTNPEGELVGLLRQAELERWTANEGRSELVHDHDHG
jgi:rhodanese-related sulfurtransferase